MTSLAIRNTPLAGDPALVDPALVDPALVDPALSDPALSDPALGDPALGELNSHGWSLAAFQEAGGPAAGAICPVEAPKGGWEQAALSVFIAAPFAGLVVAVPLVWGGWLGWHDVVLSSALYAISGHGITVGFHRLFTHGSFKANRALKVALAAAGSLAVEGDVVRWVADHRKHHRFSDQDGDPHSPWRYGDTVPALAKGLAFAHLGWLFDTERTSRSQYAPDLLADPDLVRVARAFPALVATSVLAPAVLGGLWSMSWHGAATAFFWAGLVRIGLLHHVTFSINSICHATGRRPFRTRDRSGNVGWLAALSMGESWHNLHHADPTLARHGVLPGQIDSSARVIQLFEFLGWHALSVGPPPPD